MNLTDFIESDPLGVVEERAKHALAIRQEGPHVSESHLRHSAPDLGAASRPTCAARKVRSRCRVACECRRPAIRVQPGG